MDERIQGFYFITDHHLSKKGIMNDVKSAIAAGVTIIQYRNKLATKEKRFKDAMEIAALCKENNIIFIVNDDIAICQEVDAHGVHLGQDDTSLAEAREILKDKIIGVSCNTIEEAEEASDADYIGVGPIYPTATKKFPTPVCGIETLKEIRKRTTQPIVAIGGINRSNAEEVIEAGADCIAAISATVGKEDLQEEIKYFQGLFKKR